MLNHVKRSAAKPKTLGQYLASIRKDRRMTLRQVEEATAKEVSNAYLSQIENDNVQQPSPNVLHALAQVYAIDYEQLMEMAGHILPSKSRSSEQRHGRVATFAEHNLTPEEEVTLMDYLEFIRRKKRPDDQT
ncbi:MAG: XRE family transcriptional regulator [Reyranella sp.]|uniref:helix-turn-helix domain-containing protein n=1 Tax=Reyranella sp. TaxID=1929291 RepID=UPI0012200118|nr:helix-turn-helix transcriptional regulator [Reyranella sp.]TAJ39010.1 MAG: XRE family transcriptional regulator [Reyranella sp.]